MAQTTPVVHADSPPQIQTITVTSTKGTYFYSQGLGEEGGTVYFNNLAGEGAGQVITVTMTVTGSMPMTLTGTSAFGMTPMPDTTDTGELGITYTIGISAGTENGVPFTVTASNGLTDTAAITFTQDITDPTIVSPTLNETSPYLYADDLTLYYSDLMSGTPHSFTVQGNAADNDGAGLNQAIFSSAFGVSPPADHNPTDWSGTYDDVESTDSGNGTITVTVYDNVGNWSTGVFTYIEDTITPTVEFTDVTNPDYDSNFPPSWNELDDDGSNWYDPDNLSAGWYFTSTVTDTLSGLALANAFWDHSTDHTDRSTDPDIDGTGVFTDVASDGDGAVTVTLTITDNVGNSASDTVVFSLDNTKPTIYPGSPPIVEGSPYLYANGLTVYYGDEMGFWSQAFTVQGNAQDIGVGLDYVAYSAALNQGAFEDSTHLEAWYRDYTANQYNTTSGVITAAVYDRVGNFATRIFTYTRDVTSPEIVPTAITETSPYLHADGLTLYYGDMMGGSAQNFEVQGTASDDTNGAGFREVIFPTDTAFGDPQEEADSNSPWSGIYNVLSSDYGSDNIVVTAYDNVGNWSTAVFTYIEDTTNPTVTLTYVTPGGYDEDEPDDWLDADGSNWYNADDFTAGGGGGGWEFNSYTDDDGAGLASGSAVWDHSNNDFDRLPLDCGPGGDDTFPNASSDAEGTVTVTVTIADHVGNSASDTVVFNIDNTEPTITSPTITEDSVYLYADDLTIYYGDMALATFTVNGSSDDTGVGLDRAKFSDAFGAAPSDDTTPIDWEGSYYPNNNQDWGSGTITVTVYDWLGNYSYENFYYIQDIKAPVADVTCPETTSVPSFLVHWNDSNDPPPNASGLNYFDVQYKRDSDDWQDWHTNTLLTQDTFGPASPVIVEDNRTYYFRVRAVDKVSNEQYTNGEDATTYRSGIKKVFLPIVMAPDPNWGFETGDFTSWQQGGQLAQSVTAMPYSGSYSALLGSPSYPCNGVPIGSAWLRRSVTVPSSGSPILSFHYRIFTQDKTSPQYLEVSDLNIVPSGDRFAVTINGEQLFADANTTEPEKKEECEAGPYPTPHDLYWQQGIIPLNDYRGYTIEITFHNYNWPDKWYNTYTYVDDVSVQ